MSAANPPLRPRLAPFPLLALVPLLAGCAAVGPDWHGPPAAAPVAAARSAFLRAGADTAPTSPASQGQNARWWEALGDPVLNDVEATALAGSPDLAAAQARIASARAALTGTRAAMAPSASVGATFAEASLPGAVLGRDGRLSEQIYADNFQSSWELDLFGATRRRVESATGRATAAEASAGDVAVAISAEVARVYVALRAQQASVALLDRQVACDQRLLAHAEARLAGGTAPRQGVDAAHQALAQSQADLAAARTEVTTLADQLAVLTGREPGTLDDLARHPAPMPAVPATIAVGDPAQLLRQRPDIRAAEAQLAAATADVGARMADRLPKISFTGILGLGGTAPVDAVSPSSLLALLAPQIKWSLFDGGRGAAQVRGARAARDEAEATYRSHVLAALNDAEGALARFGSQRVALAKAVEQRDAARSTAALQASRASGGTLSQADALSAERQGIRATLATITAQAQLTTGFIAVEKALGLGWETPRRPD